MACITAPDIVITSSLVFTVPGNFFIRLSIGSSHSRIRYIASVRFLETLFLSRLAAPFMVLGLFRFPIVGKKPWDGHPRKMGNRPIAAKQT